MKGGMFLVEVRESKVTVMLDGYTTLLFISLQVYWELV